MSIINEALKKAVREKTTVFSPQDKQTMLRNIEVELQTKKNRLNWGPIFILLVLVLITGPIVAPIFSTPFKDAARPNSLPTHPVAQNVPSQPVSEYASLPSQTSASTRKAQFAIEENPVFGTPPAALIPKRPELNLSGIVYSPEDSYCILNNKIVKVGDTVQGAKLVAVSRNEAKLDYQGQEMLLSVNND
mgnify:CR=1 FL=1